MTQKATDNCQEKVSLNIEIVVRRGWSAMAQQEINLEAPLAIIGHTDLTRPVTATINQVLADAVTAIREEIRAAAENGDLD